TGKIFLDGEEISNLEVNERAKKGISFAFQQPVKFKGIKVKRLLELAENKQTNIKVACDHLSKVGLCARNYLDREFNEQLSGGERKRIEIALSLAQNAQNCLFDEPEAGIDMWSFDSLVSLFEEQKAQGKCVVIVSHNEKILEIADKIVVLNTGKVEYAGNSAGFKALLPNACAKLQGGKNE
ncbi:MAG: ATP-binding cassette domain-containing protein, partial [Clostridia bacterium]|nr:ATP-binding cassette domain-containing protein [Clostridia bacterium]